MSVTTVSVLGSGIVGEVLANGFLRHGYAVVRGTRDTAKLAGWAQKAAGKASVATFAQAAAGGDVVVLAVKGAAAESLVTALPGSALAGKTVIDATNPIAESPPSHGVLSFFTGPNDSLMERLQRIAPKANLVKAFSSVGNALMINPVFPGGKPSMFICGNSDSAKSEVRSILTQFGWETEDMGQVESARAIEPLCMLWCIPGLLRHQWNHAFKLLKQ
jgi:predicted dinucleotide-binding enzyme